MSCPSCQVGGRRLPSLPFGYVARPCIGYNGVKSLNFLNRKSYVLNPLGSARLRQKKNCSAPLEDHEGLQEFLCEHPNIVEAFVLNNISQEQIERWLLRKCRTEKKRNDSAGGDNKRSLSKWKFCVHKDKRVMLEKLTSEVHQQRKKSYVVNELAKNVAHAVHADRYSLYIVDDTGKYLTSYSDNLTSESNLLRQNIETSTTISAYVARCKTLVYVPDILGDDRFPSGTGQDGTDLSVICHPISLTNGNLYGVVEFIKNANSLPFGEEDLEITCSYLTWGSIAVYYGEVAQQLNAHAMIEEFVNTCAKFLSDAEKPANEIYDYILTFAMKKTNSTHYIMFEVDQKTNEIYSTMTNITDGNNEKLEYRISSGNSVPSQVIKTGQVLNVKDAYTCPYFLREADAKRNFTTKTLLSAPVTVNGSVVGAMQVINKTKGVYTDQDICIMKLCVSYYSLALSHGQFQKDKLMLSSEVKLLKELVAYHGKPRKKELREVSNPIVVVDVPSDFDKFSFDYLQNGSQFGFWFINIAKRLLAESEINYCEKKLVEFTARVKKHYRRKPYHNFDHAFSVAHFMHVLLNHVQDKIPKIEAVAMFFACLCHDLDHRGRNNAFIQRIKHPISELYDTSLMENHHYYMTELIFENEDCNVFSMATEEQREAIFKTMRSCIIATDLLKYFEYRKIFTEVVASGEFSWDNENHRNLARSMMMTLSDLCGSCKPWKVHEASSTKVFEEFYDQGDEEIALGMNPLPMFTNRNEFPINQIGFISGIVKPCVTALGSVVPAVKEIEDFLQCSLKHWEEKVQAVGATDETMAQLCTPGGKAQERSMSFIKYNCSGMKKNASITINL